MELFQKLGEEIEALWRDMNYNEEIFPEIAAAALKRAGLPTKLTAWEIVEWTLRQNELPPQKDVHAKFGDPPITLFVAPRFYIDAYFWFDGTTAIHQHSFCGAFQVLLGSSIHSWYEFERRDAVNSFTETGDMNLKVCELLKVGDVQEIWAGRRYVHSLFHLDQPSVTIVVRTEKSPMFLPQYSYHKPFLAIDPFFQHDTTTKKIQAITTLIRSKHPDTDRLINELLETSDFQSSFSILSTVHSFLQSNQLDQLFNLSGSAERFRGFLETVRRRHGEKGDVFEAVFEHFERQNTLVRRRGFVTDPEHRFFFALLLNVDGKERIFSLIKQRFPDADPLEKVLDWTFDLAQTRVLGIDTPNALGIADFGEVEMFMLENLLKEKTEDEMREMIKSDYPAEKAEGVLAEFDARLAKITGSVIFQPLFA
jgi:hypothetical protein